jgi:hypothetical protein
MVISAQQLLTSSDSRTSVFDRTVNCILVTRLSGYIGGECIVFFISLGGEIYIKLTS